MDPEAVSTYQDSTPEVSHHQSNQRDDANETRRRYTTWLHPRLTTVRNVLLIFLPLGIASKLSSWPSPVTFILNFFAMIPLTLFMATSTRRLSESVGPVFSGLLKVSFGNIVEIIIAAIAVIYGQIELSQATLVGTVMLYALLVLGSSFLVVGYDKIKLDFGTLVTKITSSLMMVSSISLIMPTTVSSTLLQSDLPKKSRDRNIQILSYSTSIILLVLFVIYMYFRLVSYISLFTDRPQSGNDSNGDDANEDDVNQRDANQRDSNQRDSNQRDSNQDDINRDDENGNTNHDIHNVLDDIPRTALGRLYNACILLLAILGSILISSYMISNVDGLVESSPLSKTFIGLIIIPFIGITAQGLKVALGSRDLGVQQAVNMVVINVLHTVLLATPLMVILGWIIKQPMTLDFHIFEATVLFLVIMVMNSIIQEGKATYFEGVMLIGTYVVIAVSIYVRPDTEGDPIPRKLWLL